MRKIFNKALAGITTVALVATLLVGINVTNSVKADDTVALANWTFLQGGQFNDNELWNVAYINSVTMNDTNEAITGWLRGDDTVMYADDPSFNQEITASQVSTGFAMDIENNSQDKDWENDRINPWTITASMKNVAIKAGHTYTVSFKAYASKKKYCYVDFSGTVTDDAGNSVAITPYEGDVVTGSNQLIALGTTEQTFTYTFTNWTSVSEFTTTFMLGAFNSQYDFAGNDVSDIITTVESMWGGKVFVSDFTITDCGKNEEFTTAPPKETEAPTAGNNNGGSTVTKPTTAAPTVTTAAPTVKKLAKVTNVKAKNNKKKTLKITWKKVANAKTYQVKVGNKTYNTKKATLTVKKLKKGKKYTIRVRAKAAGYKIGAWSKKINVKVKK